MMTLLMKRDTFPVFDSPALSLVEPPDLPIAIATTQTAAMD
jgi:hypothetical protein